MLLNKLGSFRYLLAAVALATGTMTALPAPAQVKGLELIAPASPGGGWDQHARAVQQILQKLDLATGVQVANIPGAGGTIGLAQFVTPRSARLRCWSAARSWSVRSSPTSRP
jgi:putative tricarboxylic transport membrane protein